MNDLKFEIYIAAKPEAVWRALTEPAGVAALYFGSRLETSFEPGSPYRYVGAGPDGDLIHVEGEILACEPNRLLQLSHTAGPAWRKGPKVYRSRLSYQLEGLGFATRLSITHDQWEEGDPGYASNRDGWMILLSSIKSYVETGKPLDLPTH